jgi:hypothetical protein
MIGGLRLGVRHPRGRPTIATLTDAQLGQIADAIFVARDPATTKLSEPLTDNPDAFTAALDPIASQDDWKDAGIGVIDFTNSATNPNVWLRDAEQPFRIGSASKIGMMLAAVQLRLDVRNILGLNIISDPKDFEAVFSNAKLWKKARPPWSQMREIAAFPPLVSNIFDFNKVPVDFAGLDPNGRRDAQGKPVPAAQKAIMDQLPTDGELSWEKWSNLTFSEWLWLAGARSDNVAATACVSQVGPPYIKAVMRAYGLYDPARGMHLFPSFWYDNYPKKSGRFPPAWPRRLPAAEPIPVRDFAQDGKGGFTDQRSWVPGSAAALTAYMLAMMQNAFVVPGTPAGATGVDACETLRRNLADGGSRTLGGFLVSGDQAQNIIGGVTHVDAPHTKVTKQIEKIGLLNPADGVKSPLVCEFVYLETKQVPAPAHGRSVMKYAVIVVSLISGTGPGNHSSAQRSADLGEFVHKALLML